MDVETADLLLLPQAARIAQAARPNSIEVRMKHCTPEHKKLFKDAKNKEVQEWLREKAVKAALARVWPLRT